MNKKISRQTANGSERAARVAMPAWLAVSPWLVVAGSLLLALIILLAGGGERQSGTARRIFLERGASLIHAYEATLQAGVGFQWTDAELQAVLDRIATGPDVRYIAVTDEQGVVLAASDARLVSADLVSLEDMKRLAPGRQARGRVVETSGGASVFQVYEQLAGKYEERLRQHGRGHRMRHSSPPVRSAPGQGLVFFVGYDMTPLLAAQAADRRRAIISWSVLAFIALAGVLTLFLIRGYRRARLLVQKTTAFTLALLDALPLGLVAIDAAGRITNINPEAERITGLGEEAGMGRELKEALPALWAALEGMPNGKMTEREARCVFANGRRVPLSLTAAAAKGGGHAIILRDLGEIRRLQSEVRRQERLAALGHMAAGVAHEIRNPLSAIKGLARFFQETHPEDGEEARAAAIMTREVERLNRVVGDLLELARPDRLALAPVSPEGIMKRAANLVREDMEKAGVRFALEAPSPCPEVPLDENRLLQALLNLFLNAIEAMPNGGGLTARVRFADSGVLALTVEDTGEGIARDALDQIFSPYYTTKARGTGLGLSLVQKIVEAHDGEIEVGSALGRGTRFTLRFPLAGPGERS